MKSTVEEFYPLYRNVWKYLLKNLSGIHDEVRKKEFANSFLLQMLIFWFIQRKKFFNEDKNYFITKFKEFATKKTPYKNYFEFIIYFLKQINLHTVNSHFDNKITGKIVIPGPVIVFDCTDNLEGISIPNKCFYIKERTKQKKNYSSKKNKTRDFPILNVFDKHVVSFDGFILSGIYENFITQMKKKNFGVYYTPETITSYICKTTIESCLFDKVNIKFNSNFETIDSIINSHDVRIIKYLLLQLQTLKILDPAVGTAHILESAIKSLIEIYERIWRDSEKNILIISLKDEKGSKICPLLEISNEDDFKFSVMHSILTHNIYGVDTDPDVLKVAKIRLFLLLIGFFDDHEKLPQDFPTIDLNLKEGNSLLGYIQFDRLSKQMKLESYLPKNNTRSKLETVTVNAKLLEKSNLDEMFSKEYSIDLTQLKKVKTFHWISEFPEVFLKEGGFNIILANPPYLGESGNKELFRTYAKALPEYYEGKMDLWYLFLQRSLDLMRPNAFSSFIISSYWVTATGAARLRARMLSDTFIMQYINFGENKVFNTAQGVHINIITFKKARQTNDSIECILFDTTYPHGTDLIQKLTEQNTFMTKQEKLIFKKWDRYFHFFPKKIRVIIEQIVENSTSLKTSGFYVKEGIVTGLNNITGRQIKKYSLPDEWAGLGVFILNKENPQDLNVIESFSQEEKVHLKNFYKNSDISRYHTAVQTKKSILYLNRNTVNLYALPKIRTHIQKFQEILQESLDNPPYINRPRTQDIFISPKIVTPQRSLRNTFAYNSFNWYAAQDVYYILSDRNNKERLKSLLLILNSKLAYFWLYWMGKRKGKHLELFGEPLSYFPIPTDLKVSLLFIEICDYLLFLHSIKYKEKRFQQTIAYFETQIVDSLVYTLYLKEFFQKNTFHQSKFSLLEYLSRMIKRIEFNKWEMLHYKEKSGERLSNDEKHQLEILESQNLEIIKECYKLLKDNKQVRDLINQIKALDFVKIIEEGF